MEKSKKAFTLAEVLVTLGIIGVVMAMTLPSIIRLYKAKVMRSHFLKANTIIYDGVNRIIADEIELELVIKEKDIETLKKYFKNGHCKLPTNERSIGYKNYFENLDSYNAAANKLESPYCLGNGMLLLFASLSNYNAEESKYIETGDVLLAVDINGWEQKPNVYGKDVFFWYYDSNKKYLKPTGESNASINDYGPYYKMCPGHESWSEAGIGCTLSALSDEKYFEKFTW